MSEEEKKLTLLLVDDSEFSLNQAARALRDEYEILTALNGAEGLVKVDQHEVDLVITDLLMPNISGLAFLGRVRQRYPNTKVIVCSADVQEATAAKARELGAAAFIPKPIEPDEIRRVVRLVLSQQEVPSELPITPGHADAFKEIFNIGVGRAARALSKLVYETVNLSVPKLEIIRPQKLAQHVAETFTDDLACVRQEFKGTADGVAYLLLSAKSGLSLVNALVSSDADTSELSEVERSMLTEVGNILVNSLVGTLANTLGIEFQFSAPTCQVGTAEVIYSNVNLRDMDYVLYVETIFLVPGRHIGGNLVIVMGSGSMGTVLQGIDKLL